MSTNIGGNQGSERSSRQTNHKVGAGPHLEPTANPLPKRLAASSQSLISACATSCSPSTMPQRSIWNCSSSKAHLSASSAVTSARSSKAVPTIRDLAEETAISNAQSSQALRPDSAELTEDSVSSGCSGAPIPRAVASTTPKCCSNQLRTGPHSLRCCSANSPSSSSKHIVSICRNGIILATEASRSSCCTRSMVVQPMVVHGISFGFMCSP
mmetsp:Transcript_125773/g.245244  ORF Transcript_125773/g.245244 Transcript_125773/m.245244 type:complete len:212 (+) Transcript_125773:10-645(+)